MKRLHGARIAALTLAVVCIMIFSGIQGVLGEEPIKVGAVAGLTGFMAHDAPDCVNGLELKFDEIGWKVNGRNIELLKEDGASDVVTYVDKTRKLVEQDNVDVILGPLFSPAGFAVADYLKRSRIPNITFMAHSKGVLDFGGKNVFMWPGTLMGKGYPLGIYAYEKGYRTAVVIQADNATGAEFTGGAVKGFEEKGGKVIQVIRVPQMTMDISSFLPTIKKADCSFVWLQIPPARIGFVKEFRNFGFTTPIMIPNFAIYNEFMLSEIGDECIGMIGSAHYTPLLESEINKRFVAQYEKKYGVPPRGESVGGYIAASMFVEAVKTSGGDTSPGALNKALKTLKIETPAGQFSYTKEGLGVGDVHIAEVVKMGNRYAWKPIQTYRQMVIDIPE